MKTWVIITQCSDGLYENEVKAKTLTEAYAEAEKFGGRALCEKWELLSQGMGIVVENSNQHTPTRATHLPEYKPILPVETKVEEKDHIISRLPKRKSMAEIAEIEQSSKKGVISFLPLLTVILFIAFCALYIGAADYFIFPKLETLLSGNWLLLAKWMIASPAIVFFIAMFCVIVEWT